METEETFLSGFCKTQNQTRTVCCEYTTDENGRKEITETDCSYGACPYSRFCVLIHSLND